MLVLVCRLEVVHIEIFLGVLIVTIIAVVLL